MEKRKVDVAVIGAGTAGLGAFHEARKLTENVVITEGGAYGTTCARVGCMPSKLLIAAANAAHDARHATLFGVHAQSLVVNGREVMERVRRERDRFVCSVVDAIDRIPAECRIRGSTRFLSPHRLQVGDGLELEADRIVIATGSRTSVPDFLKSAADRLLESDDVFELEDLPGSVAVFGPGVIGLELGQALSRLGVRVCMFGVSGSIGPIRDEGIRGAALEYFNEEFYLDPKANASQVERVGDGVEVSYRHRDKGEITETFDYVLAATGRRPNVDRVGLEHSGLELDDHGMPDHDPYTMRCGNSHIFLAGDANHETPLLHEASDEGHIAGSNAGRYPDVQPGRRRASLTVVFTEPQIATVGTTIDQVEEQDRHRYGVGEVSFEDQGRSKVIGKNRGRLRLYGERDTGRFVGAEMFGPAGEHLGHLLAWAVQARMTVLEMLAMPFYHPVLEEAIRTALRHLSADLQLGPDIVDACIECGPGT